jgi:SAM-dependent methyltransferase
MDYNILAAEYARHRRLHPRVFARLARRLCAGHRVLEAGCGTGNYITALQNAVGCRCLGMDLSSVMLGNAVDQTRNVGFFAGNAMEMGGRPNSFDLVFSVDVIHHLVSPDRYFTEVLRTLKPGGWVCTVTDSEWIIRHRQPLVGYFPDTVAVDLERYPSMENLRQAMNRAGFTAQWEETVELSYDLVNIEPYEHKAFSCLHLISTQAFQSGLRELQSDFSTTPVRCNSRYVLLWGTR